MEAPPQPKNGVRCGRERQMSTNLNLATTRYSRNGGSREIRLKPIVVYHGVMVSQLIPVHKVADVHLTGVDRTSRVCGSQQYCQFGEEEIKVSSSSLFCFVCPWWRELVMHEVRGS